MSDEQTPLVLVFSTAYLPAIGGAEIAIQQIAKRIPDIRFCIVTSRFSRSVPKREQDGNIHVIRLGLGLPFNLDKYILAIWGPVRAAFIIRKEKKVLMWGMMVSQGTIAAYFLKKLYPCIPFVVTLQEGDAPEYLHKGRGGLIWFFWKRILKCADGVTAISNYLKGLASEVKRSDVEVVPNGVDFDVFTKRDDQAVAALRLKYAIDNNDIVVLSVSRLVVKNGLDSLIRAFAIFQKKHQAAKLLLVGEGGERLKLENLAKNEGVAKSVIFTGSVDHDQIVPYFHMAHVFARPSLSEGMGNVFVEAMAAGVPVVATGVGGIIDFITDDKTAVVVKMGDTQSIADGLTRAVDDHELRERLIYNARTMAKSFYSWDSIATRIKAVFERHFKSVA